MAAKNRATALPFIGVSEGIDLVKKVWGVTGLPMLPTPTSMAQFATRLPQTLPSMIAPTLDVEELDKRIADLRAVEQWLNLNLSMLRTTVQSLEVQRNTIATLKSFGGAVLSAGIGAAQVAPTAPTANWPYPQGHPAPAAPVAPPPPPPAAAETQRSPRKRRTKGAAATNAALPLNPVAWWNTLQDQFTKIAVAAAAEAEAAAKSAAAKTAAEEKAEAADRKGGKKTGASKAAARRKKRPPAPHD